MEMYHAPHVPSKTSFLLCYRNGIERTKRNILLELQPRSLRSSIIIIVQNDKHNSITLEDSDSVATSCLSQMGKQNSLTG